MTVGLLVAFITLWLNHSRRSTCGDQSLLSGHHCGSLDILWTKLIHGQSTHSQVIRRILANRRCQSTVVAVHTPAYAGSAVLIDELTRLNTIFCDIVFVARLGAWSVGSIVHFLWSYDLVPSVLWCCWLGGRKGIRPVKNWVVGYWRGYLLERGADLHMSQLMPLPLTVSCFNKIQIGLPG